LLLALVAVVAIVVAGGVWTIGYYERKQLTTGPNGPQTPASLGMPYERVTIASDGRRLDAELVRAPSRCRAAPAVLIFHGHGETISLWPAVQRLLYDRCIGSMVFDYSGSGASSRPGTIANLNRDAVNAYASFVVHFASTRRRCVLGHSMGNGPMLSAEPNFTPAPACVVVASAFSSVRDLAEHAGVPHVLASIVPDYWDNVVALGSVRAPVLVVQNDADKTIPPVMADRLFAAAHAPKQLFIEHGFQHSAIYRHPSVSWWNPVVRFIGASATAGRNHGDGTRS
jgi:uncharacterized protein